MKRFNQTLALALMSWGIIAQTAFALITIETVPVGNAGNENDHTGFLGMGGYGAVGYDYGIGKYEVTLNQYTAFLNAVGATDTYGLYNTQMGSNPNIMGIARNGVSGSYAYSVIGSGNRPVTYVSWYDSARFVNWLHNGQPTGAQAVGTTETGAYTLTGNSGLITRNAGWTYGLPSENEWFKAAYYQPVEQGGDSDGYWLYPTANNAPPNSRNGSVSDPNSANFYLDDNIANGFNGGYAVNNSLIFPTDSVLTDAGAFTLADSFYGTLDQGGNVWEWNDLVIGDRRGMRGGAWNQQLTGSLRSTFRGSDGPGVESDAVGFRVAIVPEPSTACLLTLGVALLVRRLLRLCR